ncbi:MAG: hypothetical protein JHC74_01595 [Thermoleophilia bacterium]|nr:hypothetical protein [Thermoleophilia bacterium]
MVAGRYELIRALGGGDHGQVFLADDRHLSRRVVLRVVEPAHPDRAAALRDEGRMMSAVQFDCLQAIPVLVDGELPGGGAYLVSEFVEGIRLEEFVRRRSPLPPERARSLALGLLDAGLAVRRSARDRGDVLVASALVTSDGHIRVTRFGRASGRGPLGADPAVVAVAEDLAAMLAGGPVPPPLAEVVDDARAGRILSAEVLRERLLQAPLAAEDDIPAIAPFTRWPFAVVAVIFVIVIVIVVLVLAL